MDETTGRIGSDSVTEVSGVIGSRVETLINRGRDEAWFTLCTVETCPALEHEANAVTEERARIGRVQRLSTSRRTAAPPCSCEDEQDE